MKLSTLRTFVLSLSAITAPVGLWAQAPIHATVPFDFTAGSKTLAAGEYRVKRLSPMFLALQREDGKSAAMVMVNGSNDRTPSGKVSLTFKRYGNQYFLTRVTEADNGWVLPQSHSEKELIAKHASSQLIQLAVATGN